MAEKKVVIHPSCIDYELLKKNISPRRIKELEEAKQIIDIILSNAKNLIVTDDIPVEAGLLTLGRKYLRGDVYLLREDNTVFLRDCVEKGDYVEVFGAYRKICVRFAVDDIRSTGAKATISRKGTIL